MIITISGLSGSGKSTVSKLLAQELDLQRFDAGQAQRDLAKEKGFEEILILLNSVEKQ